jgi:AcrR family transcriptional regulator
MSDPAGAEALSLPGRRQQQVEETRRRVISSARALFGEEGFHGVGLEQVAEHAGVGRKTIYFQFGSKLGLLEALVRDASGRARVAEFVASALSDDDVTRGLRRFVRGSCSVWENDSQLCRALITLAASDAEARQLLDRLNSDRLSDLRRLTARVGRRGALGPGWSPKRAADALWLVTSFETYDLLRRTAKSPGEASELLCDLAVSVLEPMKGN